MPHSTTHPAAPAPLRMAARPVPRVSALPLPDLADLSDARLLEVAAEVGQDFGHQWSLLFAVAAEELGRRTCATVPGCARVHIGYDPAAGGFTFDFHGQLVSGDLAKLDLDGANTPDGRNELEELRWLYLQYAVQLNLVGGVWFDPHTRTFD